MIYFTADEHYGQDFVRTYSNRPFGNLEEMDNEMIKRHNYIVKNDDLVFHVGDFMDVNESKNPQDYYIKQLNGSHVFLKGDHPEHQNIVIKKIIIDVADHEICLTHIADHIDFAYKLCFVGNDHEKWKVWKYRDYTLVNVGVDVWDFYPTTYDKIIERIKEFNVEALR